MTNPPPPSAAALRERALRQQIETLVGAVRFGEITGKARGHLTSWCVQRLVDIAAALAAQGTEGAVEGVVTLFVQQGQGQSQICRIALDAEGDEPAAFHVNQHVLVRASPVSPGTRQDPTA